MSFSDLKKKSSLGDLTSKLVKEVEKTNPQSNVDDRFWKPQVDKVGNGYAVLRFLPAPEGEDIPWAKMFSHAFQGPGGWYIENSLTTVQKPDPLGEYNRELWNSGTEEAKDQVRKQKRKLSFYANIYVVKDPTNPENEGQVFLYKFGKKIFDKIMDVMQPEFEDETPINPFDFWQGANFKLKIVRKDGYWNYDKSEFDNPSPLLDDDQTLEAIWNKCYSLTAVTAPDQFKDYEALKKRLDMVLGRGKRPVMDEPEAETVRQRKVSDEEVLKKLEASYKESKAVPEETTDDFNKAISSDEDDDTLDYFAKLADS